MKENDGPLSEVSGGVCLNILVQPRSSKSELAGMQQGRLKIRIAAPPVDGEANDELVRFLARFFDRPKSSVRILQGHRGKQKRAQLTGMSAESVRTRLREHGIDC